MSDMERNKGMLIPCTVNDITVRFPDASLDDLEWDTDGKFVAINEKLFRVHWEVKAETGDPHFAEIKQNDDGSISFHTYHYNGGGHWSELVQVELEKAPT